MLPGIGLLPNLANEENRRDGFIEIDICRLDSMRHDIASHSIEKYYTYKSSFMLNSHVEDQATNMGEKAVGSGSPKNGNGRKP